MLQDDNMHGKKIGALEDDMDRVAMEDRLNSDNAFNDKGLNNARLTREAMEKGNQ